MEGRKGEKGAAVCRVNYAAAEEEFSVASSWTGSYNAIY